MEPSSSGPWRSRTSPSRSSRQVERVSWTGFATRSCPRWASPSGGPGGLDRDVRVGLAVDLNGKVHGMTAWLLAFRRGGGAEGWTLRVLRRGDEGCRPTMEFLIASSCLAFQEMGASHVSLSGAPRARSDAAVPTDGALEQLLDLLDATMGPLYGFRVRHR